MIPKSPVREGGSQKRVDADTGRINEGGQAPLLPTGDPPRDEVDKRRGSWGTYYPPAPVPGFLPSGGVKSVAFWDILFTCPIFPQPEKVPLAREMLGFRQGLDCR